MNRIGPKLHPDRPKVITFGGGKGGAGRSTMCAEVARSFARQKQRVLCLDASWSCPTLNVLLHADQPQFDFDASSPPPLGEEDSHIADFIIETERDNIWLASVAAARQFPFVRPRLGADVLISQLHELDFDWVLIDLAPGLDPFQVGLFTLSDIPIVLCTPEPASIRMSTQYLRSAFYQAIGYHPEAPEARDEILEMLYEQPLQMNLDSLLEGAADSEKSREVVLDTGRHFDTYLVVNLVREGSERDLGFVLAHAWHRELNIFPRVLASIDYEDRRWFYNRRSSGLGAGRGDEAFSRDTEKLAKNLLDIAVVDARYPRPVPRGDNVHPALRIGFSKDTVQNEARQRCRRLWEGYRREESLSLVFSDPEERMRAASELEKLYREVLTMSSEDFESGVGVSIQPDEEDDSMHEKRAASSTKADSTPDSRDSSLPKRDEDAEDPEMDASDQPVDEATDTTSDEESAEAGAEEDDEKATDVSEEDATEASDDVDDDADDQKDVSVGTLRDRADSPGELIASLRRKADLSLHDLSQRTHIGVKYLTAIEEVDLEVLPREVYLRGYLREIARIFDVEAAPLIEEYFAFLDQVR